MTRTFARRWAPIAALLALAACATPGGDRPVNGAAAPTGTAPARAPVISVGNPSVGGVAMPLDQPLLASVRAAPGLATLTSAIDAAGIASDLSAAGPMTLFAPTDAAFARLAPGTVGSLLQPENRATLTKLLRLHVVAGRLVATDLIALVRAGGGKGTLTTLSGEPLVVTMTGNNVTLTDSGGNRSYVETADVRASNGVLHVVNGVLVPRL